MSNEYQEATWRFSREPKVYHRIAGAAAHMTLCRRELRGAGVRGIGRAEPCSICVDVLYGQVRRKEAAA